MTPRNAESDSQIQIRAALLTHQPDRKLPIQSGENWMFFCPCHEDGKKSGKQSLSVKFEADGSTKAYCFACGGGKDYYDALGAALGLDRSIFNGAFTPRLSGQAPTPESVHVYRSGAGANVLRVRKYRRPDGEKYFGQDFWDGTRWVKVTKWRSDIPKPALLLYNLPEVVAAVKDSRLVFVVEGEKCADRLTQVGLTATTNPRGAGTWEDRYSELLRGAKVVILPDNDEPGRQHANAVAQSLTGKAAVVKTINLQNLGPKEDVHDWLTKGLGTIDDLKALAEAAPEQALSPTPLAPSKWSQLLQPADLDNRPPKKWLLGQFLGVQDFGMVAGPPGSGKSFIILDLCLALSLGRTFAGQFPAEQGAIRVLYLASEGHEGFGQRFQAAKRKFGVDSGELDKFRLIEAVPNFYSSAGEDSAESLIAGVQASGFQPDLVIVDTFHDSITGANENDSGDAGVVLKNIQKVRQALSCAVLVVHHTGKSGDSERGSSAYKGKADLLVLVQSDGPSGELRLVKSKDGAYFNPIAFSLAKDSPDDFTESPRVAWNGEKDFQPMLTKREQEIVDFVKAQTEFVTAAQVADTLNIEDRSNVGTTLNRLCNQGLLVKGVQDPGKPKSPRNPFVYAFPKPAQIIKDVTSGKERILYTFPPALSG